MWRRRVCFGICFALLVAGCLALCVACSMVDKAGGVVRDAYVLRFLIVKIGREREKEAAM